MLEQIKYAKYNIYNNNIIKDGHTMFLEDVKSDLERKSYLEEQFKDIKDRLEYWLDSRGAYVLDNKWLKELEEFVLTGKSDTLVNWEKYKKEYFEELAELSKKVKE